MGSGAHPLHWGGADSAPGVDATVKEAPTPGCGHAVDTWAIMEENAPSDGAPSCSLLHSLSVKMIPYKRELSQDSAPYRRRCQLQARA